MKKINKKGSPVKDRLNKNLPVNKVPSDSGLLHTDSWANTKLAQFKQARNEKVLNKNGAYVVLGTDRPSSLASGYGAKGSDRAATIDLVVGRMSSVKDGDGPKDSTFVDNSFAADAARIYISQLTDVDTNFGIAEGSIGNIKGRSAIGLKADGIRIFGREGIKIVTGKGNNWEGFGNKGETNSLGGKISQPAPGIELIAGNNVEPRTVYGGMFNPTEKIEALQPITLGYNTRDALKELSGILDEVLGALINLTLIQVTTNTAAAAGFGAIGIYPPAAAASATIGGTTSTGLPNMVLNPLYQTRANKLMWEINYLSPFSYKYICSRSVKST